MNPMNRRAFAFECHRQRRSDTEPYDSRCRRHEGKCDSSCSGTSPTLLSKQRTLGRGDAALTVSALSLGIMGMQGGRGRTPRADDGEADSTSA